MLCAAVLILTFKCFFNTQVIFIMLWKINKIQQCVLKKFHSIQTAFFIQKHGLLNILASRIKINIQDFIVLRKPV